MSLAAPDQIYALLLIKALSFTLCLETIISRFLKIPWLFLQILHRMTILTMVRVLEDIWLWYKEALLFIVVFFLFP